MPEKMILELLAELQSLRVSLEGLRVTLTALVRAGEDHEARVRVLERRHQMLSPVVAGFLFVLGCLTTALIERFSF